MFQLYRFHDEQLVWWRLMSANGRGLARGPAGYPDAVGAQVGVQTVLAQLDRLETVLRLTPTYRWWWALHLDGTPVVESIGDKDRRVRCEHAAAKFVELAASAHVDPVPCTFRRMHGAARLVGGTVR
ncbi:hypothetical protein ACTHAM_000821 [Cellulomonas soli]